MRALALSFLICALACVSQAFFHLTLPVSTFVPTHSLSTACSSLQQSGRRSAPVNVHMAGLIDGILERKRKEIEELKADPPEAALALLESKKKIKGGKFIRAVKKPKGTISVVPQLKTKNPKDESYLNNKADPELMSSHCYEAGAHAMAVCTDKEAYGMDFDDLRRVVKQQQSYKGNFPSPLPVMAFDFFLDPIQLAVAADAGAAAVNLNAEFLGDDVKEMIETCDKLGLDACVQVHSSEQLKAACDAGAKLIGVCNREYENWNHISEVDTVERTWFEPVEETVFGLVKEVPSGVHAMGMGGLNETLMAWTLRDEGYTSVMVGEGAMKGSETRMSHSAYSAGFNEMKGIIMAFRSKGSKKYGPASTASFYGKGEGAKEELGMISI